MKHLKLNRETIRVLTGIEMRVVVSGEKATSFLYSCVPECSAGYPATTCGSSMPAVCPMEPV